MATVVLDTPDQINMFVVITLKSAIKLYWKTGMRANRAYTPTRMKAKAEELTGKKFKRGDWSAMVDALQEKIDAR